MPMRVRQKILKKNKSLERNLKQSGTLNALASTDTIKEGSTQNLSEYFEMNGKTYMMETTVTSDKVIATVYNDKHEIESQAVNNDAGLSLDGNLIGKNNFQTYATPNYKLVSTDKGILI